MKPHTLLLTSLLIASSFSTVNAQTFYQVDSIQTIEITFTQSNWDYQMDTAKAGLEDYIVAAECKVNGVSFQNVGVKYKGNSSYRSNQTKNPLHIELDYINDKQNYQGYKDIKLGNGFSDPSFVREVLSYEILRNYMSAPLSNYAKVYINGTYYGLYTSSQHIGKDFCKKHFLSSHGTLVKCNPASVMTYASDLKYRGTDSSLYSNHYEIKSDNGWKDLIDLCDILNNNTTDLEQVMDMDKAIWMLAFNNLFVNLDSYNGGFKQNYYLYKSDSARFASIIWDLNMSFGSFTNVGTGGQQSGTQLQQLSPFVNNTANWPLIQKVMANPQYKRKYIAHMKTMLEEQVITGKYYTRAQQLQNIINSAVQADTYKFYTSTQFTQNLTASAGSGPGGGITGIKPLMDGRITYLQSVTEIAAVAPTINNVQVNTGTHRMGDTVWIQAAVSNGTTVLLNYRNTRVAPFVATTMYDDGNHRDGTAGDNVFGAAMVLTTGYSDYYVYAENSTAGKFSPQRAEYEFYSVNISNNPPANGAAVINELIASNTNGATDANYDYEDWIELYNNSNAAVSLSGMFLTDDISDLQKWAFPADAVLPANGYTIVWCDEDNGESGFHANFKLLATGETLWLTDGTSVKDSVVFGALQSNAAVARCSNGTGTFKSGLAPSFKSENFCFPVGIAKLSDAFTPVVYPNPSGGLFNIRTSEPLHIQVYSLSGQMVADVNNGTTFSLEHVPAGLYLVRMQGATEFYTCKVQKW
ncbi:MAG TPA: CotH kinase family protein [Bacteroidia bacterium]|nr:CotH kinase family protein [Bacteroidia bacterium]